MLASVIGSMDNIDNVSDVSAPLGGGDVSMGWLSFVETTNDSEGCVIIAVPHFVP